MIWDIESLKTSSKKQNTGKNTQNQPQKTKDNTENLPKTCCKPSKKKLNTITKIRKTLKKTLNSITKIPSSPHLFRNSIAKSLAPKLSTTRPFTRQSSSPAWTPSESTWKQRLQNVVRYKALGQKDKVFGETIFFRSCQEDSLGTSFFYPPVFMSKPFNDTIITNITTN